MSRPELIQLEKKLFDNTLFSDFISPLTESFEKIRYNPKIYHTLSMPLFAALGCLRHIQGNVILREFIQSLYHLTDEARLPLPRSTISDALSSKKRQTDLESTLSQLYLSARNTLPNRLKDIPGLNGRQVYAVDGTYQKESSHFKKKTPKQGGNDNPTGHCILSLFNVSLGIPVSGSIETSSAHEITVMRDYAKHKESLFNLRHALWVVDRGFTATPFWDEQKKKRKTEVIMRHKENMTIVMEEDKEISECDVNTGVLSDKTVTLNASKDIWRLVTYQTPEGSEYSYLTNNFDLEPGVIAFLYLRRWDEEKSFDPWKNDFAQKKAWGKSKAAIQNQTTLAVITSILVALFEHKNLDKWGMRDEKVLKKKSIETMKIKKQDENKKLHEIKSTRWFHETYTAVAKTSKQIFRFLKGCFMKKASKLLYDLQLKPLYERYL